MTMLDMLEKWALKQPNTNFIIQNEQKITYREMVNLANQRGRFFYEDMDLRYGDKYSLFMNNRPEYVTNW